jgi:N-acetylglutamate synthase-like GNAT family acetyltransferase
MTRAVVEVPAEGLLRRLDTFYDAIPRLRARAEDFGSLVLFVPTCPGQSYYARPALAASRSATATDIVAVRARQRALEQPEVLEWVDEITPGLLSVAEASGMCVARNPLMLLEPAALPAAAALSYDVLRLLRPQDADFAADLALVHAVTGVGFGTLRLRAEARGVTRDDVALTPVAAEEVVRVALSIQCRQAAYAIAEAPIAGALATGAYQRLNEVAEIVGVATLPVARRHGRGSAITAALAREALSTGAKIVFLSAVSEETAHLYARIGFCRVGTACVATPPPSSVNLSPPRPD